MIDTKLTQICLHIFAQIIRMQPDLFLDVPRIYTATFWW